MGRGAEPIKMKQALSNSQRKIMDRGLPVFLACIVLPLIVRLHVYELDMSGYPWFGFEETNFTDFFNYGKAILFCTLAVWMLLKLLWERLQGRKTIYKKQSIILLSIVCIYCFLSTIFAENTSLSWQGGYQSFQGLFVLIGYMICFIYSYERMGGSECLIYFYWCNVCVSVICCVIGILQILGCDPFFWPWVQQLIIPSEYAGAALHREIRSHTVYLTMGNPNYASIFLAAEIILLSTFWVANKRLIQKILLGILDIGLFVCLWFTYSRVGLLMIFTSGIGALILRYEQWKLHKQRILLIGLGIAAGLFTLDGLTGFRFVEKLERTVRSFSEERKNCNVDDLHTEMDGVYFTQNGISIRLFVSDEIEKNTDIQLEASGKIDITPYYEIDTGVLNYRDLEAVSVFVETIDSENMIVLQIGKTEFHFVKDRAAGYLLYVGNGHYDTVQPVEKIGFTGIEHIASGRCYIWSRTIPLLKKCWLWGCGADNFFLKYPQNDYLGKAQYCNHPLTIVEKPHNAYLNLAVEKGILVAVILLAAYGLYVKNIWCKLRRKIDYTFGQSLRLGCFLVSMAYMVAFIFDDWNINVMPLFWMTIGMAGNEVVEKERDV